MKVNLSATDKIFMISFAVLGGTYEFWMQGFKRSCEAESGEYISLTWLKL